MTQRLEEVIGPDCLDCQHSLDAHTWHAPPASARHPDQPDTFIAACDECDCSGYRYEVRAATGRPSDEEVEVIVGTGRKFHGPRNNLWDTRCGTFSRMQGPQTAGKAIRAGLTPCARCYPYNPLESWKVLDALAERSE